MSSRNAPPSLVTSCQVLASFSDAEQRMKMARSVLSFAQYLQCSAPNTLFPGSVTNQMWCTLPSGGKYGLLDCEQTLAPS
jgi:hypothetical protein